MPLADELKKVVRGEVEDAPALLEKFSRDASIFRVVPEVVVRPRDAEDLCRLVKFVNKKKEVPKTRLSLTPRSGGTDMSGGPLGDSVVVDMTHFDKILEVGERSAVAEPGVYFRNFDKETKKKHLELPSYTASREINTLGGMVANDSGGEKNLKFGKTARYVEELDVVLADGKVHTLKNYQGESLVEKLKEPGFEGELYRKVAALLAAPGHKTTIDHAAPRVEKNSSGYALWDIGDGVHSLNLARLMVGAQGTLGIITKIKFSLVRPAPYSAMTVLFLPSLAGLGDVITRVLKYHPDSFESYDDHTFALAVKYFPEFAKQMGKNFLTVGFSFLPELWAVLRGGVPKLVLLVEFRADTQEEATKKAWELADEIEQSEDSITVRVAGSERAARKYWAVRRESFNLLRHKVRGMRTAPFIDDFVVPPQKLPEFLPRLSALLDQYKLTYTVAGHVGDGNFHIIPLVDPKEPGIGKTIDELSHKVYDLVISYHGSISGEHNDGLIRTPYVEKMFGPAMLALFYEVKKIFDPHNIFNPGKKVGTTFSDALAHMDFPNLPKLPKTGV